MRLATLRHAEGGQHQLAFVGEEESFVPVLDAVQAAGVDANQEVFAAEGVAWLRPEAMRLLADLDATRAGDVPPLDPSVWRLAPPVLHPGKIIAVGRNYMDHVREGQEIWRKRGKTVAIPEFPSAFAKFSSSLTGPYDDICLPEGLDDVDYEIELAVVIGKPALNVEEADALDHVAGYAICNDVATRGIQRREMEAQIGITLAKNFPSFAPIGPWLTTADAVGDPQDLRVTLDVDGEVRQDASTSDMIFTVAKLISYWSPMGLETGDILITGTPSGVALAREEPELYYLRAGQTVTARIEKLGELRNPVVRA